jgi:hypothetical protein
MSQQYKAVAALLKNTIGAINELLSSPDDELHKLSVTNDLQRTHDKLLLLTGTGDLEAGQTTVLGPAKTIGGVPIAKQRRFTEADLVPADDKVFKLKQDIEEALIYFGPEANAAGILANIPELIIRGVAKRAGLQVTKDDPAEITVEFIESIKTAVAILNGAKPEETKGRLSIETLERIKDAMNGAKESDPALTGDDTSVNETKDSSVEKTEASDANPDAELNQVKNELKADEQKAISATDTKPDIKKKAGK